MAEMIKDILEMKMENRKFDLDKEIQGLKKSGFRDCDIELACQKVRNRIKKKFNPVKPKRPTTPITIPRPTSELTVKDLDDVDDQEEEIIEKPAKKENPSFPT